MTSLSQIAWDDTVLPFQLDRSDIRGRVARLDGVLDRILAQHRYPSVVEALVAEAAVLTALIVQRSIAQRALCFVAKTQLLVELIPARLRAGEARLNVPLLGFRRL